MRPVTRPVLFRFCYILLVNLVFGVPFVSFWFFLVLRPHVADEVMVGLYVYMTPTNVSKRPSILCIYREINLVIKKQDAGDVWLCDNLPYMFNNKSCKCRVYFQLE